MFGDTDYKPDEIVHFSLVNPNEDGWKTGMSPLEAVMEDDQLMNQIKSLRNELAKTKPGTSFYIEWDKDAKQITPDQRDAIKKAIAEYRAGKQKFDETLSIPNGGKLVAIPMIGSDIPFQTDMMILREFIANAYKVPITKFMSASNRAERDTSNVEYYASAVTPPLIEIQETMNSFYIPQFTTDTNQFFAFDDCIPDDEALQMRIDTGYLASGVLSIDEVRYNRNFGESIDGGNVHYIPF
jgi:phage portal protein BeeE